MAQAKPPESRDGRGDHHPSKTRRKRNPDACEPCKKRKVKCDAPRPCTSCVQHSKPELCISHPNPRNRGSARSSEISETTPHDLSAQRKLSAEPRDNDHQHAGVLLDPDLQLMNLKTISSKADSNDQVKVSRKQNSFDILFPDGFSIGQSFDLFQRIRSPDQECPRLTDILKGQDVFPDHDDLNISLLEYEPEYHLWPAQAELQALPHTEGFGAPSLELESLLQGVNRVKRLVQSGHIHRAWTALGTIIREAYCKGLPFISSGTSPPIEIHLKRDLWLQILDLDQVVSITIGSPSGVLSPEKSLLKSAVNVAPNSSGALYESKLHFIRIVQVILTERNWNSKKIETLSARLLNEVEDCLRKESNCSRILEDLKDLIQRSPDLSFNSSNTTVFDQHDRQRSMEIADLLFQMHVYVLLMNCKVQGESGWMSAAFNVNSNTTANQQSRDSGAPVKRGKALFLKCYATIFTSARAIVSLFHFLYQQDADGTRANWPRCHQSFTASAILAVGRFESPLNFNIDYEPVHRIWEIFEEFRGKQPFCHLYVLATSKLSEFLGLKTFNPEIEHASFLTDSPGLSEPAKFLSPKRKRNDAVESTSTAGVPPRAVSNELIRGTSIEESQAKISSSPIDASNAVNVGGERSEDEEIQTPQRDFAMPEPMSSDGYAVHRDRFSFRESSLPLHAVSSNSGIGPGYSVDYSTFKLTTTQAEVRPDSEYSNYSDPHFPLVDASWTFYNSNADMYHTTSEHAMRPDRIHPPMAIHSNIGSYVEESGFTRSTPFPSQVSPPHIISANTEREGSAIKRTNLMPRSRSGKHRARQLGKSVVVSSFPDARMTEFPNHHARIESLTSRSIDLHLEMNTPEKIARRVSLPPNQSSPTAPGFISARFQQMQTPATFEMARSMRSTDGEETDLKASQSCEQEVVTPGHPHTHSHSSSLASSSGSSSSSSTRPESQRPTGDDIKQRPSPAHPSESRWRVGSDSRFCHVPSTLFSYPGPDSVEKEAPGVPNNGGWDLMGDRPMSDFNHSLPPEGYSHPWPMADMGDSRFFVDQGMPFDESMYEQFHRQPPPVGTSRHWRV